MPVVAGRLVIKSIPKIYKMANRNSPQFSPLQEQVLQQLRIVMETPLDNNLPQPEMTPSPATLGLSLGLYYRVDVEALNDWATVTLFMRGSFGFVVQEPDVTDNFRHFLSIMQAHSWKSVFWLIKQ